MLNRENACMMMTVKEAIQSFYTSNISYMALAPVQDYILTHTYICIKNTQSMLAYNLKHKLQILVQQLWATYFESPLFYVTRNNIILLYCLNTFGLVMYRKLMVCFWTLRSRHF